MSWAAETSITLPMPPSVNRLYVGASKTKRKRPAYISWSNEAGWRINEARAAGECRRLRPDDWYWTDIRLPQCHLGDTDNRLKAVHDILHQMQVTPDDKWLLGGTYMRCANVEPGTCMVFATTVAAANLRHWEQVRLIANRMIATNSTVQGVELSGGAG